MWKWLHPYAKTERCYALCQRLLPWFSVLGLVSLVIGCVWGLAFAPSDYQQGDSYRIIFIHVPSAILSKAMYSGMAAAAFIGLVWQVKTAFMAMIAMAPIGAMVTFVSLITGAAWGKPMWGTWWEWDARLTSQLILLFLFLGVIALYKSFNDVQQAGKAAGVMALVGIINLPIIHYSVEWWNTLHQGATILKMGKPSMPPDMLQPLLFCIVSWMLVCAAIFLLALQNEILRRDIRRPWVIHLVKGKNIGTAQLGSTSRGQI
ncbi:MAG: heme ABC transporter permease [Paraglaciecola sp.]|nr:heme ABC transporter permease [Paraglaciecola sp.]NCT47554.1 heme ABC transporter permease [Paraglaciecola sp.]